MTGTVLPLTPVGAQAGGLPPLGLSPGADGDRGAEGAGGQGPAGEEGVRQEGLAVVVSPSLAHGGARGWALQVSSAISHCVAYTPDIPAPGEEV